MTNATLRKILHKAIYEVTFTKVDGTERVMHCTLNADYITKHDTYVKKTERTKAKNEDVLSVFDTEKGEWRAFRYDSVTSMKKVADL